MDVARTFMKELSSHLPQCVCGREHDTAQHLIGQQPHLEERKHPVIQLAGLVYTFKRMTKLVNHGPPPQQLFFIGRSQPRTEVFKEIGLA
jgi:hypothetical protein